MDILVTGVASQSPLGKTEDEIVSNLKAEKLAFKPYNDIHGIIKSKVCAPCEIELSPLPRSMDSPMAKMSLWAVLGSITDAGFTEEIFESRRTGFCSAIGIPDIDRIRILVDPTRKASPFDIIKTVPTSATGALATHLKMKGPVYTVQHACASGLRSISQGMDLIRLGKADVVVCSAAEMIFHDTMKGFDSMRALKRGDFISNPSKPFSSDRAGFVFGEGCGAVVLESREHYNKRQGSKKNYGSLVAYQDYSDGNDITNPSGHAAIECMEDVFEEMNEYGIPVSFISAHATSTPNGDRAEAAAINYITERTPVVALKRLYGHSATASAMVEFIHCLYMMKYNFIISNGDNVLDPALPVINLPDKQLNPVKVGGFIKNAFGFGGLNSVIGVAAPDC